MGILMIRMIGEAQAIRFFVAILLPRKSGIQNEQTEVGLKNRVGWLSTRMYIL